MFAWKPLVHKAFALAGVQVSRLPRPAPMTAPQVTQSDGADYYKLALYRKHYPPDSLERKAFYNVGAAGFHHPCWTNMDFKSDWYAADQRDIVNIDLMKREPLPIENNSAEIIYTSHTIEHVSDKAVANLCREAYRVLKPGGYFRITNGPDVMLEIDAVRRGDDDHFYWDHDYDDPAKYRCFYHHPASSVPIEERWLHHTFTQLAPNATDKAPQKFDAAAIRKLLVEDDIEAMLDSLAALCTFDPNRPGNHISWWTPDKAMRFMREGGFETVYRSAYGQSHAPVLRDTRFFDAKHPSMSLYVEARKENYAHSR